MGREVLLKTGHVVGIIAGSVLLTGLILSAIFSVPVPPYQGPSPLFGNAGILPFAATIVTIGLLAVGAAHALRTLDHTRRAEAATRFQKGAEMLGSDSLTTRIAGIYVISDVARDWPELYAGTALNTIAVLLMQNDVTYKESLSFFGGAGGLPVPIRSDRSTPRALTMISQMNEIYQGVWPDRAHCRKGKLLVQELFINHAQRSDEIYTNIEFRHTFIGRWHLNNSNLRGVRMSANISNRFAIADCDLTGAKFNFYELDMVTPRLPTKTELIIAGGQIAGATVNGQSAAGWYTP